MKKFLKHLFCRHVWQLVDNVMDDDTGEICHTYKCKKCGKIFVGVVINPYTIDADKDDTYNIYSSNELRKLYNAK